MSEEQELMLYQRMTMTSIKELQGRVQELESVLRSVEYAPSNDPSCGEDGWGWPICPSCQGAKHNMGHTKECAIRIVLGIKME